MSQRFYCPDPPRDGRYRLPADEARHLARVCRHVPGDRVEIFDGKGFATTALIVEIGKDSAVLVAQGLPIHELTSPCSLTLATAIPKGDRFDWLVEKATELGITRLIPLVTEHSVVDPRDSKLERLRRTIIEASKQSRRNRLMVLDSPLGWVDLVRSARPGGASPGPARRPVARPLASARRAAGCGSCRRSRGRVQPRRRRSGPGCRLASHSPEHPYFARRDRWTGRGRGDPGLV